MNCLVFFGKQYLLVLFFITLLYSVDLRAQGAFTGSSVMVNADGSGDFISLQEAAENYNTYGISDHTTLIIAGDLTETQTVQFKNAAGSDTYQLTISTNGGRHTVSGNIKGPVIRFSGAVNIIMDGNIPATASNLSANQLVVRNTYPAESADVAGVHVVADSRNIIIRNTEIANTMYDMQGNANLLVATDGIVVEGCYLHTANENLIAQDMNLIVFRNNVIRNSRKSGLSISMYYPQSCEINGNDIAGISGDGDNLRIQGIFLSTAGLGTLVISDNVIRNINNLATGDAGAYGMVVSSDGYLDIRGNTISNISNASSNSTYSAAAIFCILGELGANGGVADLKNNVIEDITDRNFPFAIEVFSDKASARGFVTSNTVTGITASAGVTGNNAAGIAMKVPGVVSGNRISGISASSGSAKGLYGMHSLADITLLENNFLWDIKGKNAAGAYIESGTGFKVYHNTVYLSGKNNANDETACIVSSANADFRNNLLVITAPGDAATNQAVKLYSSSSLSGNRYHITNGAIGRTVADNVYQNINSWNSATGDLSVRLPYAPVFISASDLHLSGASVSDPLLHTALLTDVPSDADGDARLSCRNAAGADNFNAGPVFSAGNSSARTVCAGLPSYVTFEATGGVMPYRYSIDGGTQTMINADSITLAGNAAFSFSRVLADGNHTLQLTDVNGCAFTSSPFTVNATGANIWYVNQAVTVSGDGASPGTAFKDLQEALSNPCLNVGDSIKVAEGTYQPSVKLPGGTTDRDMVFYINKSVHLNGAYNPDFTMRDTVLHATVLSGDIGLAGTDTDNTYHVVVWNCADAAGGSMDGLVIRDGNANGSGTATVARNNGGGLFLNKGILTVSGTVVRDNIASGAGGGIYAAVALTLQNVIVENNKAGTTGGGISTPVSGTILSLYVSNTTINDNSSGTTGGGIYSFWPVTLENATVSRNRSGYTGSGFSVTAYSGGGIYANNALSLRGKMAFEDNTSSGSGGAVFKNTTGISDAAGLILITVTGNTARNGVGGGIHTTVALDLSYLSSGNISGNTASGSGGGIYANNILKIKNSTLSGNKAGYQNGAYLGTANHGGGIYANHELHLQGKMVFENDTANGGGGAVYKNGTTLLGLSGLDELIITGNMARTGAGGGIYTTAALDLSGLVSGNISNNMAGSTGGGISTPASGTVLSLNISNTTIKNNSSGTNGGGIYCLWPVTLGNTTVSGNRSGYTSSGYSVTAYYGGGIYANNALSLLGKMVFEDNTSSGSGGAVYKNTTGLFDAAGVTSLTVTGNTARNGTGGGIYTAAAFDLSSGNISGNVSSSSGGGIYANNVLKIKNSTLSGNKAGYQNGAYLAAVVHGGGIFANNTLTLAGNMVFQNDTASNSGGAIFKNGTTAFDVSGLDELTITGNTALNGTGGGIYTAAVLDLSGISIGTLNGNTAGQSGGAVYAAQALSLGNTTISGNKAGYASLTRQYSGTANGGGIYAGNALTLAGVMVFENDTANSNGGAIYKSGTTAFNVSRLTRLMVNNNATNLASTGALVYTGGGGIWTGASLDLSRVLSAEFKNNSSKGKGGAVCAGAAAVELAFNNAVFENNRSGYDFESLQLSVPGWDYGGAVYAANTLTLQGNTVFRNNMSGSDGGAVYANNNLNMKNSLVFESNGSGGSGGAVWKSATGNINVAGLNALTINNNSALGGNGGGIYTMALSLELSEVAQVKINNNKASMNGGGIYMGKDTKVAFGRLSLRNSTLSNNHAGWDFALNDYGTGPYDGGAVYVNMAALMLSGTINFENNGASGNGGAVWKRATFVSTIQYTDGPFDVTGLDVITIKNNRAGSSGGGIYTGAPLDFYNLKSGVMSQNIAGDNGGSIFGSSDLDIVEVHFLENTAGNAGGAVYAEGLLEVNNSTFSKNRAVSGGALYKGASGSMTVLKSTFTGNRADAGGALTSDLASSQTVFNSTFSGNTAAGNGGAILFSKASGNTITYSTFNDNRTDDNIANAIYYTGAGGILNGNIIYGNGSGTEVNSITGLATQYNIVRNPVFSGTGDQNLAAGNGSNIFASATGDVAVLADNGGSTQTLLIKTNGPAHNQIVFDIASTFGPLGATDQRGENRVTGFTDIGSVELVPQPCSGTADPVVWYVDDAAAPGGDGTSIPNRADNLNTVLTNPCLKDGDTIKVAQGTYYPTDTDPAKSFIVLKGVVIQGGYLSDFTETNRNIITHPTIFDGKSLSYHVVIWNTANGKSGTIDGVTIRNGKATGSTPFIFAQNNGGGILQNNGALTVSNSVIADNMAANKGGGIHVSTGTALTLKNVVVRNNKAGYTGSAYVTTSTGTGAVQLETRSGGGVMATGKLELQGSVVFDGNIAGGNGGGIFLGLQCVFVADKLDELIMTGCESKLYVSDASIAGNFGGGGIFTTIGIDLSHPQKMTFTNCIAAIQGGGIFINDKTGKLTVLQVANADFTGCKAMNKDSDGGAIESYYGTQSVIVIRNSTFKDCYTGRYGGALGIGNALRLEGTVRIDNCTAGVNGGGISQWGLTGLPSMFDVSVLDTLEITNCKSNLGGAIWVQGTSLALGDVKQIILTGNYSKTHGGAIYMNNTSGGVTPYTLTLNNAVISDNRAGWDYAGNQYSATAYNGGGIHATSSSPVILKGSITLSNNVTTGNGGGIYGSTTITGAGLDTLIVTGNEAMTATGGGIYAGSSMDLSGLKSGEISRNMAKTNGGGIFANNTLSLIHTSLEDNKAGGNGGAVYKNASGNLTINESTLSANTAIQGGGVFTASGTNTFINSTFSRNEASDNGGGLYATGNVVKILFSTFNGNLANGGSNSGNALYFVSATSKTLHGNIIYGNGLSGTETNLVPATATYNIVRDMSFTDPSNVNLAAGSGNIVFKNAAGDVAMPDDNGGSTKTLMIIEQNQGGLAHNFIPVNIARGFDATITTDQRDSVRFAKCRVDCGSVEIQRDIASYELAYPLVKACPYTLVYPDMIIAETTNIKDTLFYSDKNYTLPLTMPAKNVNRIYVKFISLDDCVELKDTIRIDLTPSPTVKVIGGKSKTICSGNSVDLTVNIENADEVKWYGWEKGGMATGVNTGTLHFTSFQRTTDTAFYIRATVNNWECNLSVSDSVLITLKGLPAVTIEDVLPVNVVCVGQSVTLTAGAGFATYAWSVTPAGDVSLNGMGLSRQETFTWSTKGNRTVGVTVTDFNGCAGKVTTEIAVIPRANTEPIYRIPNRL